MVAHVSNLKPWETEAGESMSLRTEQIPEQPTIHKEQRNPVLRNDKTKQPNKHLYLLLFQGLIPSNHMASHNLFVTPVSGDLMPFSDPTQQQAYICDAQTHMQVKHS